MTAIEAAIEEKQRLAKVEEDRLAKEKHEAEVKESWKSYANQEMNSALNAFDKVNGIVRKDDNLYKGDECIAQCWLSYRYIPEDNSDGYRTGGNYEWKILYKVKDEDGAVIEQDASPEYFPLTFGRKMAIHI